MKWLWNTTSCQWESGSSYPQCFERNSILLPEWYREFLYSGKPRYHINVKSSGSYCLEWTYNASSTEAHQHPVQVPQSCDWSDLVHKNIKVPIVLVILTSRFIGNAFLCMKITFLKSRYCCGRSRKDYGIITCALLMIKKS